MATGFALIAVPRWGGARRVVSPLPGPPVRPACGHALAGSAPAPPTTGPAPSAARTAGPVAERRVCSVLFCDVVGFTPLAEARDPEAVRELLSRYFEVARTVIGRYGGVVEKFIGDAVMAVWGTPTAAEGDAERAVRAALDLVAAVAQLGTEAGVSGLAARAGVVTGEVAVTLGASGEGMVAGDAVNTAARVQGAAEPGQVLADGATQRLAEGGVGFADAGEQREGQGGAAVVAATRVLAGVVGFEAAGRAGGPADRPGRRAAHHPGAVPRRRGAAGAAHATDLRARRGGQVAAGLGVRQVHQRAGGGRVGGTGAGACPTGRGWRSGRWPRSSGSGFPSPKRTRPRWRRASWRPGWTGWCRTRPSGPTSVRGWAGARRELCRRWRGAAGPGGAVRRVAAVLRAAGRGGLAALLIEDAQYADTGLLDFLDHLIDWARDLPIYVLVFARPNSARPASTN